MCGPSQAEYNLVQNAGMNVLTQVNDWNGAGITFGSAQSGWNLTDEPDMQGGTCPGTIDQIKNRLPADGTMRYSNYGKGVAFWASDATAACWVNGQDLVSTDVYWFTDGNACGSSEGGGKSWVVKENACHVAANYGGLVNRERSLISPARSKPVWAFVEVGEPMTPGLHITNAQIRAAVWHSIIAGARGIIYFNHSFNGPCVTNNVLRDCGPALRDAVRALNAQIQSLRDVLDAPFVASGFSASPNVRAMAKWQGGHFYVFAGTAGTTSATGSLAIPCVGSATATVVGENRTIPVSGGAFTDSFADGNAVHIYRIDGGSSCGLT
jgi:hypothetical protein